MNSLNENNTKKGGSLLEIMPHIYAHQRVSVPTRTQGTALAHTARSARVCCRLRRTSCATLCGPRKHLALPLARNVRAHGQRRPDTPATTNTCSIGVGDADVMPTALTALTVPALHVPPYQSHGRCGPSTASSSPASSHAASSSAGPSLGVDVNGFHVIDVDCRLFAGGILLGVVDGGALDAPVDAQQRRACARSQVASGVCVAAETETETETQQRQRQRQSGLEEK